MTRNISGRRKVLSPTRCGGSPLPEGAKRGGHAPLWISTTHGWWDRRVSISSTGICIVPVRTVTSTWAAPFSGRDWVMVTMDAPAAEMPDQIPKPVQQERFDRLLALQAEIGAEKNAALVGQTLRVLCDGVSKTNPALYSGRTDGYKIAFFPGDARDVGRFIPVRITRADAFALWGERAD